MRSARIIAPSVVLAALCGCAAAPRDPQIEEMARQIDAARVRRIVDTLAGFGTRHTMSLTDHPTRGIGAARQWIKGQFDEIARDSGGRLRVELDAYLHEPDNHRITRPTQIVNVVATLPGAQAESADRYYVVSAHYDSICSDPKDPDCDAPGADDDASGVAVVLELARVMSRHQFDATIVFMAVAGEEQGLLGSKHWAAQARKKGLNIAGMFTNDIVGASRGPSGVNHSGRVRVFSEGIPITEAPEEARLRQSTGYDSDAPARQLARFIDETVEAYLPGFDVALIFRRDRFLRGGDHTSFSQQGYPAVRFTEFEEDFAHQHQTPRVEGGVQYGDLPEFCDFEYIADVARANLVALATLARAPAPPRNVRMLTAGLTNDTTLKWHANHEPDLAGYEVVWRATTAPTWQRARFVGNVTQATIPLSKDNWIFGLRAVDDSGHASPAVIPVPSKE